MTKPLRKPSLSALVVAHDEALQLADCLERLAFCDELVVLLDRCSDNSEEVARSFTQHIESGAWPIEGDRRNHGIALCSGDWVLEIDADERVTPDLALEIRAVIEANRADVHRIPVDNYIGKRLVRHGWGASIGISSKPILFRKGVKRWGHERVHPKLSFAPAARQGERLNNRLVHYVDRNLSDFIRRFDRYTTARAADLRDGGDPGSAFRAYRRILSRFWKCFVGRKGYREGGYGFLIAMLAGLYPFVSWLKAKHERE